MELQIVIIKNKGKGVAAWVEGPDAETGRKCRINLPSVQIAVTLTKHLSMSQASREDVDGGIKYIYS
jgi:hypothetical protein